MEKKEGKEGKERKGKGRMGRKRKGACQPMQRGGKGRGKACEGKKRDEEGSKGKRGCVRACVHVRVRACACACVCFLLFHPYSLGVDAPVGVLPHVHEVRLDKGDHVGVSAVETVVPRVAHPHALAAAAVWAPRRRDVLPIHPAAGRRLQGRGKERKPKAKAKGKEKEKEKERMGKKGKGKEREENGKRGRERVGV